jgi:drug/metabolite transporter (DMT)-like permease
MLRLIILVISQSVLLVAAQSFLKISVMLFGKFAWTWHYFKTVFTTWQFAVSGVCALSAMIVWMYTLKRYDFSLAYPLLSISYVIGLLAAFFIFHETIPLTRWIGVVIVMIGVYFIAK